MLVSSSRRRKDITLDGLTRRTDIVVFAYLVFVGALITVNRASQSALPSWKVLALVHLVAAAVVYALRFLPERLPALA